MIRRVIIGFVALLLLGLIYGVFSLVRLKNSIKTYSNFWTQKALEPGDFTYVALGDSTAQGIGATAPMKGYVGNIANRIEEKTGRRVRIINLSVSGAEIEDAANLQLKKLGKLRPDLITIQIGANNVARGNMASFATDYDRFAAQLPPGTFVANMPYFGGRISRNESALQAGEIIAAAAKKYQLILVDLQTPLREQQSIFNYSIDLFHPSDKAYKIWAEAFWEKVSPTVL